MPDCCVFLLLGTENNCKIVTEEGLCLSSDQLQVIQNFLVFPAGAEQVDAGGFDAAVAQNIC